MKKLVAMPALAVALTTSLFGQMSALHGTVNLRYQHEGINGELVFAV